MVIIIFLRVGGWDGEVNESKRLYVLGAWPI